MREKKVIESSLSPLSTEDIFRDLQQLGIQKNDKIILHVSLKSLGWVIGAEVALLDAILHLIGPQGSLVMPTQTGNLGDPSEWENPPVPSAWVSKIKATMPAFNPLKTPSYHMGRVAELFRTWPGVIRSNHPHASFCAWGANARKIMEKHALDSAFGVQSPLDEMLKYAYKIVLMGVGYDVCTALHYAESKQDNPPTERKMMVLEQNGERVIKEVIDIAYSTRYFKKIGAAYEAQHPVKKGLVGHANTRVIEMPLLIDFAEKWLRENPKK